VILGRRHDDDDDDYSLSIVLYNVYILYMANIIIEGDLISSILPVKFTIYYLLLTTTYYFH